MGRTLPFRPRGPADELTPAPAHASIPQSLQIEAAAMASGKVLGIYLTPQKGAALGAVQSAHVVAGRGIVGDRNYDAPPPKDRPDEGGRQVTLIEAEAHEYIEREHGIRLPHNESRRNIVTTGIALNDLVGREFQVGAVRLRGVRLCHPCGYLERLTQPGVRKALEMRGGLRCDVVEGGTIAPGDAVEA